MNSIQTPQLLLDTISSLKSYLPAYITQNYKYIALSFAIILLSNYLAQRYSKTSSITNNKFYTRTNEFAKQIPIKHLDTRKLYTFWNGNTQSTYHLTMLLKQGHIIQPLYIEEYTILKGIDNDKISEIINHFKSNLQTKQTTHATLGNSIGNSTSNSTNNPVLDTYITYLKRIKAKQSKEITVMENMRKIIKKQLPEYESNFLPTMYITAIAKDMSMTNEFARLVKKVNPLYEDHFEVIEQMFRFAKYFAPRGTSSEPSIIIDIPLTTDSNCYSTFQKVQELDTSNTSNTSNILGTANISKVYFPLLNKDLDKEKIKIIAMEHSFYNILQLAA